MIHGHAFECMIYPHALIFVCLFVCVGVLRPSQQRGHVEPVS